MSKKTTWIRGFGRNPLLAFGLILGANGTSPRLANNTARTARRTETDSLLRSELDGQEKRRAEIIYEVIEDGN